MDHWTHKVIRCYYLTCDVSSCWIIHFVAIYSDLCRMSARCCSCCECWIIWIINNNYWEVVFGCLWGVALGILGTRLLAKQLAHSFQRSCRCRPGSFPSGRSLVATDNKSRSSGSRPQCEWHRVTISDTAALNKLWTFWTFIIFHQFIDFAIFCQTNWPQIEIKHPPPSANCLAERVGASMFSCVFGAWLWDSRTSFQAGHSRLTAASHCTPCCSPRIYIIYNIYNWLMLRQQLTTIQLACFCEKRCTSKFNYAKCEKLGHT
jgi:hypothetical protein